jgi:hypothetical protein
MISYFITIRSLGLSLLGQAACWIEYSYEYILYIAGHHQCTASALALAPSMEVEGEESSEALAFKLEQDRSLSTTVRLGACCPTMDLLALVTADSQVLIHRLSWQKLIGMPAAGAEGGDSPSITAICWHPDGTALVLGYEDGRVATYNVEDGRETHSQRLHDAPITCLHFGMSAQLEATPAGQRYADRSKRLFPTPPPLPDDDDDFTFAGSGTSGRGKAEGGATQSLDRGGLVLLASGDARGSVCLSVHGVFLVGRFQVTPQHLPAGGAAVAVAAAAQQQQLHVTSLCIDAQIQTLSVGVAAKAAAATVGEVADATQHQPAGPPLALITVEMPLLGAGQRELYALAQHCRAAQQQLGQLRATLELVSKQW